MYPVRIMVGATHGVPRDASLALQAAYPEEQTTSLTQADYAGITAYPEDPPLGAYYAIRFWLSTPEQGKWLTHHLKHRKYRHDVRHPYPKHLTVNKRVGTEPPKPTEVVVNFYSAEQAANVGFLGSSPAVHKDQLLQYAEELKVPTQSTPPTPGAAFAVIYTFDAGQINLWHELADEAEHLGYDATPRGTTSTQTLIALNNGTHGGAIVVDYSSLGDPEQPAQQPTGLGNIGPRLQAIENRYNTGPLMNPYPQRVSVEGVSPELDPESPEFSPEAHRLQFVQQNQRDILAASQSEVGCIPALMGELEGYATYANPSFNYSPPTRWRER